jgi:sulfate permease, SulP family
MSGPRGATSGLARYLPAVGWLAGYQGPWLRGDLAAGVTTAAVVIPQAMAYATIAGLPVQVGLYVATVPMLVYALSGTSRPLSVSTTSTAGRRRRCPAPSSWSPSASCSPPPPGWPTGAWP